MLTELGGALRSLLGHPVGEEKKKMFDEKWNEVMEKRIKLAGELAGIV